MKCSPREALRVLPFTVAEDLGKEYRKLDLQRAALTVVLQATAGGPNDCLVSTGFHCCCPACFRCSASVTAWSLQAQSMPRLCKTLMAVGGQRPEEHWACWC